MSIFLKLKKCISKALKPFPVFENFLRTIIYYYRNVPMGAFVRDSIKRWYKRMKHNKTRYSATAFHLYQTFLPYKNHKL